MSTDLVRIARQVAAHLRGEVITPAKYAVCDIGWSNGCKCDTCRARWSASKVVHPARKRPISSR